MGIRSSKRTKAKRKRTVEKDTEFYQEIWDEREHYCEECGRYLGEVWDRSYFSHILTKGAHPKLRRVKLNIQTVCRHCHSIWEFGDRTKMKTYRLNMERIQKLFDIENSM
jgi:hypothetical protein